MKGAYSWIGSLARVSQELRTEDAQRRCCVVRARRCCCRWQGSDKLCDSLTVALAISKKLYSDVAIFTPANHRYFNFKGHRLMRNGYLQCQVTFCIQRDVATYLATGGREVE